MVKAVWTRLFGVLPAALGIAVLYFGSVQGFRDHDITLWRAGSALHITGSAATVTGFLLVVVGVSLLRQSLNIFRGR